MVSRPLSSAPRTCLSFPTKINEPTNIHTHYHDVDEQAAMMLSLLKFNQIQNSQETKLAREAKSLEKKVRFHPIPSLLRASYLGPSQRCQILSKQHTVLPPYRCPDVSSMIERLAFECLPCPVSACHRNGRFRIQWGQPASHL